MARVSVLRCDDCGECASATNPVKEKIGRYLTLGVVTVGCRITISAYVLAWDSSDICKQCQDNYWKKHYPDIVAALEPYNPYAPDPVEDLGTAQGKRKIELEQP